MYSVLGLFLLLPFAIVCLSFRPRTQINKCCRALFTRHKSNWRGEVYCCRVYYSLLHWGFVLNIFNLSSALVIKISQVFLFVFIYFFADFLGFCTELSHNMPCFLLQNDVFVGFVLGAYIKCICESTSAGSLSLPALWLFSAIIKYSLVISRHAFFYLKFWEH